MQAKAPQHTTSDLQPAGVYALKGLKFGLFALGALMAALHIIERSGLPSSWAFAACLLLLLGFGLALVALDRTFDEADFTLNRPLLPAWGGGVLLGVILSTLLPNLLRPAQVSEAMAMVLGAVIGLSAAHVLARRQSVPAALMQNLLQNYERIKGNGFLILLLGFFLLVPSGLILHHTLPMAARELSVLTGLSLRGSLALAAGLFLFGLVLGGGRTVLAGLAVMTALIAATGLLLIIEGFSAFGALPLPGLANETTLTAIFEARQRWMGTGVQPPLINEWPGLSALFSSGGFNVLVISAALSALVARSLSPAIPLRRKTTAASAITALVVCALAGVAIGGYAIEAAGSQLIGASLDRAPQRLLDNAGSGLIRICGAVPSTLESLRAACGITGRGAALSLDQLKLEPRFLWSGLPQSIGLTSTLSAAPRALPTLFSLVALFWAGWIIALALGRGLLAYGQWGPGQASQRLAYVRVAGALGVCVIAFLSDTGAGPPDRQIWLLAAGAGALALLLDFGLNRGRTPLVLSDEAPLPRKTRKMRDTSPSGEAVQL
jgi:hypothetical protein